MWQAGGKLNVGPLCEVMNKNRLIHCLCFCKSIEKYARADAIVKKYLSKCDKK